MKLKQFIPAMLLVFSTPLIAGTHFSNTNTCARIRIYEGQTLVYECTPVGASGHDTVSGTNGSLIGGAKCGIVTWDTANPANVGKRCSDPLKNGNSNDE